MAEQWQFRQDEQQQWHWTRTGEAHAAESGAFATQLECYIDAVRHAVRARRPDTGGVDVDQTHFTPGLAHSAERPRASASHSRKSSRKAIAGT